MEFLKTIKLYFKFKLNINFYYKFSIKFLHHLGGNLKENKEFIPSLQKYLDKLLLMKKLAIIVLHSRIDPCKFIKKNEHEFILYEKQELVLEEGYEFNCQQIVQKFLNTIGSIKINREKIFVLKE